MSPVLNVPPGDNAAGGQETTVRRYYYHAREYVLIRISQQPAAEHEVTSMNDSKLGGGLLVNDERTMGSTRGERFDVRCLFHDHHLLLANDGTFCRRIDGLLAVREARRYVDDHVYRISRLINRDHFGDCCVQTAQVDHDHGLSEDVSDGDAPRPVPYESVPPVKRDAVDHDNTSSECTRGTFGHIAGSGEGVVESMHTQRSLQLEYDSPGVVSNHVLSSEEGSLT